MPFTVLLRLPSQGDLGQDGAELPAAGPRAEREAAPGGGGGEAAHPGGDAVPAAELGDGGCCDAVAAQLPEGVPGEPGRPVLRRGGRSRPRERRLLPAGRRQRERVRVHRQPGVAPERVPEGELQVPRRVRRVHHPGEKPLRRRR